MYVRFKTLSMIVVVSLLSLPALFAMKEAKEVLPAAYTTQESVRRFVERHGKFIVQVENKSDQDVTVLVRSKSPFQKGAFEQTVSHTVTLSGDWGKGTKDITGGIFMNLTPVYGEFRTYRPVNEVIILAGEENTVTIVDPNDPKYGRFNKLVVYTDGRAEIKTLAETKSN